MEKLICLGWLMLASPTISNTELIINQNAIIIQSTEEFEGYLYRDDQLVLEVRKEDYEQEQIVFEELESGIYTLYDKEGMLFDREFILDENMHMAFDVMVRKQKDHHYLFQKQPKVLIITPIEDKRYESQMLEELYVYEIQESQFDFLENTYSIYVDDSDPVVQLDNLVLVEEGVYVTNQSMITIDYYDEYPELFEMHPENNIEIKLHDGINDLSCYLSDMAQNKSTDQLWVVYDSQAPSINEENKIYINKEKMITISERYLDFQKSYYKTPSQMECLIESKDIYLNENGVYEFYLYDLAGNKAEIFIEVVIDVNLPELYTSLDEQIFSFSFSEPLRSSQIKLTYQDEEIPLINNQAQLKKEGVYLLGATLEDLAGNRVTLKKEIVVDYTPPYLRCNLNQEIYLSPVQIQVSGSDFFKMKWHAQLYKNNKLIYSMEGEGDFNQYFSKNSVTEDGSYELRIYATDTTYESQIFHRFILDQQCEPISFKVDGHQADGVNDLFITKDVRLNASCVEGDVYYRLYKNEEIVSEHKGDVIHLKSKDGYTKIEFYAYDSYGHKATKWIELKYPTTLEMDNHQKENAQEVESPKKDYSMILVGGVIFAIVTLRYYFHRKNRFIDYKDNLSTEQTLLLQDSEDTQLLHSTKDS